MYFGDKDVCDRALRNLKLKKNLKNMNAFSSYCDLKFQPLKGVYVSEHRSHLVIFLNISISGDKIMKQISISTFLGSRNLFFHIRTL